MTPGERDDVDYDVAPQPADPLQAAFGAAIER